MAGGVRIFEPAVDLAVCCSIVSSIKDFSIDNNTVIIGEVGLGGEIRSVSNIEKRIKEAEKLVFTRIIVPGDNYKEKSLFQKLKVELVNDLSDAIKFASSS